MCQDEGQGALWTVGTSQVPETSPFGGIGLLAAPLLSHLGSSPSSLEVSGSREVVLCPSSGLLQLSVMRTGDAGTYGPGELREWGQGTRFWEPGGHA